MRGMDVEWIRGSGRSVLALLVVVAMVLAACSGDDDDSGADFEPAAGDDGSVGFGSALTADDEALAFLGITADADRDTARRAYLRLLRVHRPERDASGFRRLREAWERVEAVGWSVDLTRDADAADESQSDNGAGATEETASDDAATTDADQAVSQ